MMKKQSAKFAWMMLTSLAIVIAATFVLCLADLGSVLSAIVMAIDAAVAVVFSACPTMAERAEVRTKSNPKPCGEKASGQMAATVR